jgi:hypothetical protein
VAKPLWEGANGNSGLALVIEKYRDEPQRARARQYYGQHVERRRLRRRVRYVQAEPVSRVSVSEAAFWTEGRQGKCV